MAKSRMPLLISAGKPGSRPKIIYEVSLRRKGGYGNDTL
jgi:hypothetical protein